MSASILPLLLRSGWGDGGSEPPVLYHKLIPRVLQTVGTDLLEPNNNLTLQVIVLSAIKVGTPLVSPACKSARPTVPQSAQQDTIQGKTLANLCHPRAMGSVCLGNVSSSFFGAYPNSPPPFFL